MSLISIKISVNFQNYLCCQRFYQTQSGPTYSFIFQFNFVQVSNPNRLPSKAVGCRAGSCFCFQFHRLYCSLKASTTPSAKQSYFSPPPPSLLSYPLPIVTIAVCVHLRVTGLLFFFTEWRKIKINKQQQKMFEKKMTCHYKSF